MTIDKILELLENEKLIECLDLRDGDGNPINNQQLVDLVTEVYNQAIQNCKKAIVKEYDE
tara:strand:- start:707 stop:886 length:180 start_codon:yes stop_codon:yes gene_type:complete